MHENGALDGKVIELESGYRLGPLSALFPFSDLGYSEPEIALINHSENNSSVVQRGVSRWMGGVYADHPHDMIRVHFDISHEVAERYGIEVDETLIHNPGLISALTLHDVEEDYQPINDLRKALWAIKQQSDNNVLLETDLFKGLIMGERGKLGRVLERGNVVSIERLKNEYGISVDERDRLLKEAATTYSEFLKK